MNRVPISLILDTLNLSYKNLNDIYSVLLQYECYLSCRKENYFVLRDEIINLRNSYPYKFIAIKLKVNIDTVSNVFHGRKSKISYIDAIRKSQLTEIFNLLNFDDSNFNELTDLIVITDKTKLNNQESVALFYCLFNHFCCDSKNGAFNESDLLNEENSYQIYKSSKASKNALDYVIDANLRLKVYWYNGIEEEIKNIINLI